MTVNALHPGTVNTELSRHIGKMSIFLNKFLVKTFLYMFFKTPKAGAQTTIYAGLNISIIIFTLNESNENFAALDPDLDDVSGQYFELVSFCKYLCNLGIVHILRCAVWWVMI